MAGIVENFINPAFFHNFPCIHHIDVIRHFCHHSKVMGDIDHRNPPLLLDTADQLDNLCLDGHIQRSRRLVGQKQARPARQRDRNNCTLLHSARKLMRVIGTAFPRNTHHLQKLHHAPEAFLLRDFIVHPYGLRNLIPYGKDRIQCRHRILKDHGDPVPADFFHLLLRQVKKLFPFEENISSAHLSRRIGKNPDDCLCYRCLSCTGFSHQPQRLALFQHKRYAVYRMDHAFSGRIFHHQVFHSQ